MTTARVPVPLYALFQEEGLPVVLLHGKDICWLPFFTSPEYAAHFLTRASLGGCKVRTLITLAIVNQHISDIAKRLAKRSPAPAFRIAVDPLDSNVGTTFSLLEPAQFLTAVEQFDKPA